MPDLAAIYTRISSDREGLEHGIIDQERSCREFAERLGLTIYKVYSDNNISASRKSRRERPEFDQMLKDARNGAFQHILALSQSRLTRRPREFEDLIELFEETGVRIRTLKSGDYDLGTADGRAQARNNATWDTLEAERTSERVKAAVDRRARDGIWHGGTVPYGYDNLGKQLTINPPEAAMIQEAAKRILAGDTGYSIVFDWNGRGKRTR